MLQNLLQCQPNVCIISEEVEAKKQTLNDIVNSIADTVAARAANGNNFGTVLGDTCIDEACGVEAECVAVVCVEVGGIGATAFITPPRGSNVALRRSLYFLSFFRSM